MTLRTGSLFSGYGGLDLAVNAFYGAETAWHVEYEAAPSKILAHHWPDIPNHGDVTRIDWAAVEPVDILTGGFPCQDVSAAGRRAGLADGTRSGLWSHMAEAINQLRPRFVVIENVRGLLSASADRPMESDQNALGDRYSGPVLRALGAVLGDLSDLGYDAQWTTLAASDVGACHRRQRVFILATPADADRDTVRLEPVAESGCGGEAVVGWDRAKDVALLPTPSVADAMGGHLTRSGDRSTELLLPGVARAHARGELLPTPRATDGTKGGPNQRGSSGDLMLPSAVMRLLPTPEAKLATSGPDYARMSRPGSGGHDLATAVALHTEWGDYAPAIQRQERLSRPAPPPTEPNSKGNPRLAPQFPEWMMMLPAGWVTDPAIWNDSREVVEKIRAGFMPATARNDQLKAIGNGVVPAQAYRALELLAPIAEAVA